MFSFKFSNDHLIWTWNFNSKLLFWILKINTPVWKLLIESKNGHFNSEYIQLFDYENWQFKSGNFLFKFKNLIWSKN